LSLLSLLILALALAMDATAVAAAKGLACEAVPPLGALRIALLFGGFQAGMAGAGAFAGTRFAALIEAYDHWIAFALLGGIGGKMIWEALRSPHDDAQATAISDPFAWRGLVVLAIATSIDALAAGVTLPLVDAKIPLAVGVIGVVTAVLSFAGVYTARKLGDRLGKKLDLAGGVVLVLLGLKTLVEHLTAR
jgi:putative Mn2+ efflux pump MntP